MLTRLVVRNFKGLANTNIELGSTVVFIGPNNSGKTSALQALALWQSGLDQWLARRGGGSARERTGVTLNRTALTHTPTPDARMLWRNLRVQNGSLRDDESTSSKVLVEVVVEGQDASGVWAAGLEFYYANQESIYCRPLRDSGDGPEQLRQLQAAARQRVAFLPAMSGLVAEEPELQAGRVDVLIGEGQTAQVLRNLCLSVLERGDGGWNAIKADIERMFGVLLKDPTRVTARGSIKLEYGDRHKNLLDIASAGRGLQQVLLLLAHIRGNPGKVLLLDEPDAHLEILRQREIYTVLTDAAAETGAQIIAASHSEIVLNEAAQRDSVVAFIGPPHRLDAGDRGSQLVKALREIGFDQYYLAEDRKVVLYLEGATDLRVLQAFAKRLSHPVQARLSQPFVKYVGNQPAQAADHFNGLREAVPSLRCFALFDRLDRGLPPGFGLGCHMWQRREIENYLCSEASLTRFAAPPEGSDLFAGDQVRAMRETLEEVSGALRVLGHDPWGPDTKASDEVLRPIFRGYYNRLGRRNEMDKADYHELAGFLEPNEVDPEVRMVLDRLEAVFGALDLGTVT